MTFKYAFNVRFYANFVDIISQYLYINADSFCLSIIKNWVHCGQTVVISKMNESFFSFLVENKNKFTEMNDSEKKKKMMLKNETKKSDKFN